MCSSYLGTQTLQFQKSPPSFFFPSLYMLSMTSYGVGYPSGQLGSAVLAGSSPTFLCTPRLLTGGVVWEAEKALTLCKNCSAVTKTSLHYQHCFQHKCKAESPTRAFMKKINSIPAKTSTDICRKAWSFRVLRYVWKREKSTKVCTVVLRIPAQQAGALQRDREQRAKGPSREALYWLQPCPPPYTFSSWCGASESSWEDHFSSGEQYWMHPDFHRVSGRTLFSE